MQPRPLVEFGHQIVGGGQQQGVVVLLVVLSPGLECHVDGHRVGADMDALVVDVERDTRRITLAQSESGLGFGGRGEPHHLRQGDGSAVVGEVAQHASGAD